MGHYRIAVLPGDGIGPEVMAAALEVLRRVLEDTEGLRLDLCAHEAGAAHFLNTGVVLPDSVLTDCLGADAVLLAAIGLPAARNEDGTEVQPTMMMRLRRALGLYAAVRPVELFPGVRSPLQEVGNGINFVIVRENLEGLFASFGGGCIVGEEVATDTIVMSRGGVERVVDFAFQLARQRSGRPSDGRRVVTCVDKANVFRSFAFFRKIFFEIAGRYPETEADAVYVDAMCLYMVQRPDAWDVLVMENQFGDILSDLAAGLVGGLGLAPSAEIGEHHAMFQPSHGSAPDIAGQNIANPLAMILSVGMMLDWLGETHDDDSARGASRRVQKGVADVLADGKVVTRDLGGSSTTSQVGEAVVGAISGALGVSL